MKKAVCIILSLLFAVTIIPTKAYAQNENIIRVELDVVSTELEYATLDASYIDGLLYLRVSDIAALTRSKFTLKKDTVILTHGSREITINHKTGELTEDKIKEKISVTMDENHVLIHAYPILTYLGAECSVDEYGRLIVKMPVFTLWEGLGFLEEESYITRDEFGGKGEQGARLFFNSILLVFESGLSSMLFDNAILDAMSLPLQLDISKYESCKNKKIEKDRKYDSLTEAMIAAKDMEEDFLITYNEAVNPLGALIFDPLKKLYKDDPTVFGALDGTDKTLKFTTNMSTVFGEISESSKYIKDSVNILDAFQNNTTPGTSYQYSARSLYLKTASGILNAGQVAIQMAVEELTSAVLEKSVFSLIDASLQTSANINKLLYGEQNSFAYSSAENNAIILLKLKEILFDDMARLAQTIIDENYSNQQHIEDYRLLSVFYYRVLIIVNEQFEALIIAQGREGELEDVLGELKKNSNLFAEKVYVLTLAEGLAFPDLNGLKDNFVDTYFDPGVETTPTTPTTDIQSENNYNQSNSLDMYHLSLYAGQYAISGNYKYYTETYGLDEYMEPVGGLYKKNLSTGEETLLKDNTNAQNIQVVGNKVFYTLYGGGPYYWGVHMINTDGTGYKELYNSEVHCFVADENNVYFAANDSSKTIKKISHTSNTGIQTMTKFNYIPYDMNLVSGGIVYRDEINSTQLSDIVVYNFSTNSQTVINSSEKSLEDVWVNGNYIYCLKWKYSHNGFVSDDDGLSPEIAFEREFVRYNVSTGVWECCDLPAAEYQTEDVVGTKYYNADIYSGLLDDFEKELPKDFAGSSKYVFTKVAGL